MTDEPESELIPDPAADHGRDLIHSPELVLGKAAAAARALMKIVDEKPNPVIFNNRRYVDVNDYQAIAKMFGISAKAVKTEPVEYGGAKGFISYGVAIDENGMEISAATMMCLDDEPNWSSRRGVKVPAFQLMSMAQTRVIGKCLRNVLGFVAVMAGFDATAVEEMTGTENVTEEAIKEPQSKTAKKAAKKAGKKKAAKPQAETQAGKVIGMVEDIQFHEFTKADKSKGERWGVKIGSKLFGTFSAEQADFAREAMAMGEPVELHFEDTGKYLNLITISAAKPGTFDL